MNKLAEFLTRSRSIGAKMQTVLRGRGIDQLNATERRQYEAFSRDFVTLRKTYRARLTRQGWVLK